MALETRVQFPPLTPYFQFGYPILFDLDNPGFALFRAVGVSDMIELARSPVIRVIFLRP